ncbi:response regulator transcription factor [Amycolatopsis coloradensis]|uniref:response regulator transcription factor n=1 Tax=Amycolatopsis coloradensis TaxID=76021 RepID=UPI00267CD871
MPDLRSGTVRRTNTTSSASSRASRIRSAEPLTARASARNVPTKTTSAEVLRLIAKGRSSPEIAADLVLSAQTVKTYVGRILAKLGSRDRAQAIVPAYETGLVSP